MTLERTNDAGVIQKSYAIGLCHKIFQVGKYSPGILVITYESAKGA